MDLIYLLFKCNDGKQSMLQKLFVSYQLCTDPLRKEWLLAAPALRRPVITEPTCCAKDQTAAGDTLPPQGLRWAQPNLGVGHPPGKGACTGRGSQGRLGCRPAAVRRRRCCREDPGFREPERAMKAEGAVSYRHAPAHGPATPLGHFAPHLLQASAPLRTWHRARAMQGACLPTPFGRRGTH